MCRAEDTTADVDETKLDRPPIPHDGGADPDKGVPCYRERLAHGTDQGKWLLEQVKTDSAAKRRGARPAARVFHDVELLHGHTSDDGKDKKVDALAVRQGAISIDENSGMPLVLARPRTTGSQDARCGRCHCVPVLWLLRACSDDVIGHSNQPTVARGLAYVIGRAGLFLLIVARHICA